MIAPDSNGESPADRFQAHVDLLHEFFKTRGVVFGEPKDMLLLTQWLAASGALREEMASVLRTICYREDLIFTNQEMLNLVCVAVSGPQFEPLAEELQQPVTELGTFVHQALRSIRRVPFDDLNEAELAPEPVPSSPAATPLTVDETQAPASPLPPPELLGSASLAPLTRQQARQQTADAPPLPTRRRLSPPANRSSGSGRLVGGLTGGALLACLLLAMAGAAGWLLHPRATAHKAPLQQAATAPVAPLPSSPAPPTPEPASVAPQPAVEAPPAESTTGDRSRGRSATRRSERLTRRERREAERQSRSDRYPRASNQTRSSRAGHSSPPSVSHSSAPSTSVLAAGAEQPETETTADSNRPQAGHASDTTGTISPLFGSVASGIMSGHLLAAPQPRYPRLASLAHIQGQVILQAVVASNGRVVATRVLRGHRLLRGAAVHAVRQWRYRPYVVDGRATDVATIITLDFRLPH